MTPDSGLDHAGATLAKSANVAATNHLTRSSSYILEKSTTYLNHKNSQKPHHILLTSTQSSVVWASHSQSQHGSFTVSL